MSVEELALGLSRPEKLRLMEALWTNLSEEAESFESPPWHETALRETEARVAEGSESVLDWKDAKIQLNDRR